MKKYTCLALLMGAMVFTSCKKSEVALEEESLYKESGYLVSSVNETTNGYSYYAGFFDVLPGSTSFDMTTKSTYNYLYSRASWKNFIFGSSLKADKTITKIAVSKTGQLTEVASLPLLDFVNNIQIINDNLAVYTTWGSKFVGLFNPTTMEKLGEIDMSKAKSIAANIRNYYAYVVYRKQDNRLFLALMTDSDKTSAYYDATDIYVEVVNLTTKQWEKTTTFTNATYPISRGNEAPIIDEDGNIYVFTQGSYGLDGQMGPNAAKYSRPQILKIPAGSTDFDPTYSFNPVDALGQQNLLVQLMLGAIYDANGIAYSCISAQSESARILELVQKYAQGKITETEFYELRNAIFYSPNQRWVKLDLKAKTVNVITDIPFTAGFGYPNAYKYDGKLYFQYNSVADKTSGYYEYTPSTGKATKVVSISNGGIVSELIKLSK